MCSVSFCPWWPQLGLKLPLVLDLLLTDWPSVVDGDKCTVVTGDQSTGLTQSADILLTAPKGKRQEVRSKRQEARGMRQEARGSRHVQELLRS